MARAKKYDVGPISRKHLAIVTEILLSGDDDAIVAHFNNRAKPYVIRGRKLPHGIELKWGKTGTFFVPGGYYGTF